MLLKWNFSTRYTTNFVPYPPAVSVKLISVPGFYFILLFFFVVSCVGTYHMIVSVGVRDHGVFGSVLKCSMKYTRQENVCLI